jgi:hypothetical protein
VHLIISNEIFIEKESLPSPLLNRLIRIAAFQTGFRPYKQINENWRIQFQDLYEELMHDDYRNQMFRVFLFCLC